MIAPSQLIQFALHRPADLRLLFGNWIRKSPEGRLVSGDFLGTFTAICREGNGEGGSLNSLFSITKRCRRSGCNSKPITSAIPVCGSTRARTSFYFPVARSFREQFRKEIGSAPAAAVAIRRWATIPAADAFRTRKYACMPMHFDHRYYRSADRADRRAARTFSRIGQPGNDAESRRLARQTPTSAMPKLMIAARCRAAYLTDLWSRTVNYRIKCQEKRAGSDF